MKRSVQELVYARDEKTSREVMKMPDCPDNGNLNPNEAFPNDNGENERVTTQAADSGVAPENGGNETANGKNAMKVPEETAVSASMADLAVERSVPENNTMIFGFQGEAKSDEDNHLGKGLIKPTSVQVAIDGYHFSYEKPTPRLAKAESFMKETIVEKRMADSEFDFLGMSSAMNQPVTGKQEPENIIEGTEGTSESHRLFEEGPVEGNTRAENEMMLDTIEDEMVQEKEEDSVDPVCTETEEPTLQGEEQLGLEGEFPAESLPEEPPISGDDTLDSEPVSEPNLSEDLFSDTEPVLGPEPVQTVETTFLAGRQTWFGVPLPSLYRITNMGIVLIDSSNRSRQIPWGVVAEVRMKQSMLAKILGIGNIEFLLEEGGSSPVIIEGVMKPKEVLKKIEELMNREV
ncbi:MAG TPA: hypothetical protein PL004_08580 [Bacillota bacterium]|nr:hypothetical protein [Bacillota bacterium]